MIVVGAGHAGCEAALAAARMGCRTLLLTLSLDRIAWQVGGYGGGGEGYGLASSGLGWEGGGGRAWQVGV